MLVTMSFAGSSGGRAAGAAVPCAPAAGPAADGGAPPDAGAEPVAGGVQPASSRHAANSAGESVFTTVPLAPEHPTLARGGQRAPRRSADRPAPTPPPDPGDCSPRLPAPPGNAREHLLASRPALL